MRSAKLLRATKSMTARTVALTVFGRNAAKQLELELGCSSSQAWRIVSHGRVPSGLAGDFWDVVERKAESLLVRVETARRMARAERMLLRDRRLRAAAVAADEGSKAAVDLLVRK